MYFDSFKHEITVDNHSYKIEDMVKAVLKNFPWIYKGERFNELCDFVMDYTMSMDRGEQSFEMHRLMCRAIKEDREAKKKYGNDFFLRQEGAILFLVAVYLDPIYRRFLPED